MTSEGILHIHPFDNTVVALQNLASGVYVEVNGDRIQVIHAVPAKHKIAIRLLEVGEKIIMYGIVVGIATKGIRQGEILNTDNVKHFSSDYHTREDHADNQPSLKTYGFENATFDGYHRSDGSVGTANHWIVIPLVFCENRNLQFMRDAMLEELGYQKSSSYKRLVKELVNEFTKDKDSQVVPARDEPLFKNVNLKFISHTVGCGGIPEDAKTLCGLLAGYITHPNVAGATVLSLGCQDAQVSYLMDEIRKRKPDFDRPVLIYDQQEYGTEKKQLDAAIRGTFQGLIEADKLQREPAPANKLVLGVECGGSDGFSGLSANPAIGFAADILVSVGGTVILSEFPELCGVEQNLIDRCVTKEIARKFIKLQGDYARLAESVGAGFYLNPSVGNIKDGLITDAMKSAGALKKGGSSPVTDVLDYPELATKPGLNLLCTPGNDVESTTGLVGSGANIVLFSTGLGTPTGNPVAPVIKVSSNSDVARKMHDIIDIDAGTIIDGIETLDDVGIRIFRYCLDVASGREQSKAVLNSQDDFIPWKRGISL